MSNPQYRPCFVKGKKALFHRWEEIAQIRDAVMTGQMSGQIKQTFGIVEYEDGTIYQCYPNEVRFCDRLIKDYCFAEQEVPNAK